MRLFHAALSRVAAGLLIGMPFAATVQAKSDLNALAQIVAAVEQELDGRVGLIVQQAGQEPVWASRSDERFVMTSTFKAPLCGAVLAAADQGKLQLDHDIAIQKIDLVSHAPVTEKQVGRTMSIADLCLATIDLSDNTAANLLIKALGGPAEVTALFRSLGDETSRLDRYEPELNLAATGDLRDTTTPQAMADLLESLLVGDALPAPARAQLAEWMQHGGVTASLLRDKLPEGWQVYDKSGGGSDSRSLIAVSAKSGQTPWVVTIYLADMEHDFATRNAALQKISAAVAEVIVN